MSHFVTEQAKAEAVPPLGLYVHVPFCASTCDFCAFYQTQPTAGSVERFLKGVRREAELVFLAATREHHFLGGGHARPAGARRPPPPRRSAGTRRPGGSGRGPILGVDRGTGPGVGSRLSAWQALREIGVTRVRWACRASSPRCSRDSAASTRVNRWTGPTNASGRRVSPSVNLDLMFCPAGQTEAEWAEDIRIAVDLAPDQSLDLLPHVRGGYSAVGEAFAGPGET